MYKKLLTKIKNKDVTVGVIGLGYVGLPLLIELSDSGYRTVGYDVNENKVQGLKKSLSYVTDIPNSKLEECNLRENFVVTDSCSDLHSCEVFIIAVPTPIDEETFSPDLFPIKNAVQDITPIISYQRGHQQAALVILESTVYPGVTEENVANFMSKRGMTLDKDLFVAFSPERVDPGNPHFTTKNTPKLVGGVTEKSCTLAVELYKNVIDHIIPTPSAEVAEFAKVYENCFRAVNIALVNELMKLADRRGLNFYDILQAAATKPFGFMPFSPGPGVGGHCIPVDPKYISHYAKMAGTRTPLIDLALDINESMPHYTVNRIQSIFANFNKSMTNVKILLLGMAYKKDISDCRDSPSLIILEELLKMGCEVEYNDPYVPSVKIMGEVVQSVPYKYSAMKKAALTVVLVPHSLYDPEFIMTYSQNVLDTKNFVKGKYKNLYTL